MAVSDPHGELAYLSAAEAGHLYRTRKLSPVELMEAVIERAVAMEPVVNAFTERMFDEALEQAVAAERRFLGRGGLEARPLEGIPVATKEKHAIAGRELSEGSLPNAGTVAEENAPVIDRIRGAGGIIHARTTMPEFSAAAYTFSKMWGTTRNPWNPEYTPGGSSGGSAASLAAGTSVLATGSDIGGSIRIPAAFTGTVGYKPPYGRIPGAPPFCLDHYRADGPMTRTVADCITFTNVLAGPDARDHASLRPTGVLADSYPSIAAMRIGVCVQLGDYRVHPDVEANTLAVAAALEEGGALVTQVRVPWRHSDIVDAVTAHYATIFGATIKARVAAHPADMNVYSVKFANRMDRVAERISYVEGLRIEARLQYQLAQAMAEVDALICPTCAVPGLPAEGSPGDTEEGAYSRVVVGGRDYGTEDEVMMTIPFNITNRCPVLSVPSGMSSWGVPTGVQIVGHTYDDATVFRVAKAIEELRPWSYGDVRRPVA